MLTAKKVERAKPGRYRDGEVKGLYLQVRAPRIKAGCCGMSATASSAGMALDRPTPSA